MDKIGNDSTYNPTKMPDWPGYGIVNKKYWHTNRSDYQISRRKACDEEVCTRMKTTVANHHYNNKKVTPTAEEDGNDVGET